MVAQLISFFEKSKGRWDGVLHAVKQPPPIAEYDEAHEFLVGLGHRHSTR